MLRISMLANGYEFDWSWWEKNADFHKIERFVTAILNKDTKESKKKVVAD